MQIHAYSKGKLALDISHSGRTVVRSDMQIAYHFTFSFDGALYKCGWIFTRNYMTPAAFQHNFWSAGNSPHLTLTTTFWTQSLLQTVENYTVPSFKSLSDEGFFIVLTYTMCPPTHIHTSWQSDRDIRSIVLRRRRIIKRSPTNVANRCSIYMTD